MNRTIRLYYTYLLCAKSIWRGVPGNLSKSKFFEINSLLKRDIVIYPLSLVYSITRKENDFTWATKGGKEVGHGKISGKNLTVQWQGPGGSGQAAGKIALMNKARATRIE